MDNWMSDSLAGYFDGERPDRVGMIRGLVGQVRSHLNNQTCRNLLSIGSGVGSVDAVFLEQFGTCSKYYGVEPSSKYIDKLEQLLRSNFPNLKSNLFNCTMEDFTGLEEPVDVIVASFVVHMFSDKIRAIRYLLEWLSDDGLLIFTCCGDCTFMQAVRHYHGEHKYLYTKPDLLEDLETIGANKVSVMPSVEQRYDFRNMSQNMANVHLMKVASESEIVDLNEYLYSKYPSGIADITEWIVLVRK